ncbi:unnamed protein product, partial [Meganyctiphanes norvegica]
MAGKGSIFRKNKTLISFDATYIPPGEGGGFWETGSDPGGSVAGSLAPGNNGHDDDDQQMLLNVEQNIANLERSISQRGPTASSSCGRLSRRDQEEVERPKK